MRKIAFACLFIICAVCLSTVAEAADSKQARGAVSARAVQTAPASAADAAGAVTRSRLLRIALDIRHRTFLRLRGLPILPPAGTNQIIDNPDPIGQAPAPDSGMGLGLFGETPDGGSDDTERPDGTATGGGGGGGGGGSDDDEDDGGNG